MKNRGSLVGMLLIFVAGVLTGIGISAWKLDTRGGGDLQSGKVKESEAKNEIRARISGLEKMLAANPDNLEALIQLGNDYFDMGNYEKSVNIYQNALKIDPTNPEIATDMGVAYRRLGKTDESIKFFRKALEIDPNQALAMFNLGMVLRDDKKDLQGALKVWKTFLEKAPESPHAVMIRPWVRQLEEKLGAKDKNVNENKPE
ncbi:MAG: tetratricopeptide repeat protein [Deltaproteobacteria bacterium]|nr:tetratricopeptide repeat protein [Deltaproteobacteria bacterium]